MSELKKIIVGTKLIYLKRLQVSLNYRGLELPTQNLGEPGDSFNKSRDMYSNM